MRVHAIRPAALSEGMQGAGGGARRRLRVRAIRSARLLPH